MTAPQSTAIPRRRIGRTSVEVTALGLGGGALGGMYSPVAEEAALAAVRAAYRRGVRYFDTAPLYGHGLSESRLGEALAGCDRDGVVLSTKVGVTIEPRDPGAEDRYADPFLLEGHYDFGYDACLRSLEGSMERLGTDRVDIVYVHDPDEGDSALEPSERTGANHLAEVMDGAYRALDELRSEGVVGAVGIGLNGTDMLVDFMGHGDFDCFLLAGRYTLLEQQGLDDLLPLCLERGTSIVVGGVFNSGILASGARKDARYNYRRAAPEVLAKVGAIEALCDEHGVRLPAAALQFPLAHPAVAAVIPGMRSAGEADANAADLAAPIPPGLWSELRRMGLVDAAAPLPSSDPRHEHRS